MSLFSFQLYISSIKIIQYFQKLLQTSISAQFFFWISWQEYFFTKFGQNEILAQILANIKY